MSALILLVLVSWLSQINRCSGIEYADIQDEYDVWAVEFKLKIWTWSSSIFFDKEYSSQKDLAEIQDLIPTDVPLHPIRQLSIGLQNNFCLLVSPISSRYLVKHWLESQTGEIIVWYEQQRKQVRNSRAMKTSDPLVDKQWHFWNSTTSQRPSLNTWPAWKSDITGKGVTVAVVDDGADIKHEDLQEAIDVSVSWDFISNTPVFSSIGKKDEHGTRCAGQIAARMNGKFGAGVAYDSTLSIIRLIGEYTYDALEASALTFKFHEISIYSLSWGPADDGIVMEAPGLLTRKAMREGVTYGRQGKGSIYVLASGNGGRTGDSCGADGYATSRYTIAVGSVDESGNWPAYSERCSAQLITTFGGNHSFGVQTIDINNGWTSKHYGTSAAAPFLSGSLALLLQLRPDLRWRDIQNLLVKSARSKPLENDSEWMINGAGLKINPKFGFGLLDVSVLLENARSYMLLPSSSEFYLEESPKHPLAHGFSTIEVILSESSFESFSSPRYLEHVELVVSVKHSSRGKLKFSLQSPMNTTSIMLDFRPNDQSQDYLLEWSMSTVHMWGENSSGKWKIIVENLGDEAQMDYFKLIFHGVSCEENDWIQVSDTEYQCPWEIKLKSRKQAIIVVAVLITIVILVSAGFIYKFYLKRRKAMFEWKSGNREGSNAQFMSLKRSESLESNRFSALLRTSNDMELSNLSEQREVSPLLDDISSTSRIARGLRKSNSYDLLTPRLQNSRTSSKLNIVTRVGDLAYDELNVRSPVTLNPLLSPMPSSMTSNLNMKQKAKVEEGDQMELFSPKSPRSKYQKKIFRMEQENAKIKTGVVKKIVLTGGPCGGKSTVQTLLSDVFSNMGWKVFRVPETATVLLSGGVNFAELSHSQAYQFQKDLLLVMLRMEQTFFNLAEAETMKGHDAIVVCDRGAMDASAYIGKHEWNQILSDLQMSQVEIRDQRYDYVVHLVSAANGAESFYGHETNNSRSENLEHARSLDSLCQDAWIGHPYFDIIDNSTPFDEKCQRVIGTLLRRIGLPDRRYGRNISKYKFLVDSSFDPFCPENLAFPVSYQDFLVEHVFLNDENHTRIRRRTQNGTSHFNLTMPKEDGYQIRRTLSGREYDILRSQADSTHEIIVKNRRCFLWNNKYFQLDQFLSPKLHEGLVILEAYLESPREELPKFIPIERDVTGNADYSMWNLSSKSDQD